MNEVIIGINDAFCTLNFDKSRFMKFAVTLAAYTADL